MKSALNNTSMISSEVAHSYAGCACEADRRWLDAWDEEYQRMQEVRDQAQAEEDAQSEREQAEYSNALITFGELVDGGQATVEELNEALDRLMQAARHNPYGQDVGNEAEECVENSNWQIEWSAVNRIVPRPPSANPALERLSLANVRMVPAQYDFAAHVAFDALVDGKNHERNYKCNLSSPASQSMTPPSKHVPTQSLSGYADDVVEIGEDLGLENAVFVGHSVSAMIGMLASIKARRCLKVW